MKLNPIAWLALLALLLGGLITFWLFAIIFTASMDDLFLKSLLPLGLMAVSSFTLAWAHPTKWKLLATLVALPAVLMSVLFFVLLGLEGKVDWDWMLVSAVVLAFCLLPGWWAKKRKTGKKPS